MVTLPEEPANIFMAGLETRDLQALTPDMVLYEPEYWSRYELEMGEEGEGGTTGYENALSNEDPSGDGAGWPHLEAYITTQALNAASTPLEEVEVHQTGAPENAIQPAEEVLRGHDNNIPLNELFCQWNTQSTIGDVLRDFHWIIAYVLEGMQQYEAGMAPWPRVPQGFDQRMRSLNAEDTEGNISIASASRRVISLLESTGIPQADSGHGSIAARASKIPRLIKKDVKVETVPNDLNPHSQASTDQEHRLREAGMNVALLEQPEIMSSIDSQFPRALSWSIIEDKERTSTSHSPDKRGDLHPRVTDLGHAGSKIPVLSPKLGGVNIQSIRDESTGRSFTLKGGESSPKRSRRGRLMAGEMLAPPDMVFSRGRKITRDSSPLTGRKDTGLGTPVQTKIDNEIYLGKGEEENMLEEIMGKKKDNELDKENHRPEA